MHRQFHLTSVGDPQILGEIVEGFRLGLCELGCDITSSFAQLDPSRVNIVMFASASLQWKDLAHLGPDCIVVNFEQLMEGGGAFNPTYLEILRNSYVWEYSQRNLARYAQLEIPNASLVPYGYQAGAIHLPSSDASTPDADIDVLFFGHLSPRRLQLLDDVRRRGLQVAAHQYLSLEERSALLARSKLLLNVSTHDNSRISEIMRMAVGFAARKPVLTELYDDSEIHPDLRPAVFGAPYAQLAETAERLIAAPEERHARAELGHQRFAATSQAALLRPALADYLAWRDRQAPR